MIGAFARKRATFSIGVSLVVVRGALALATPFQQPDSGWHTYSNGEYGYVIQYPSGYELRVTGPEGERDGATILIVRERYTALAPALYIQIEPRTPEEGFPSLGTEIVDMTVHLDDVRINDLPARRAQYRWKANDDLAFVEVLLEGVLFRFDAAPGTREFPETPWGAIVATFRRSR